MLSSSSISQRRFEEQHPSLEREVRQLEYRLKGVQENLNGHSPPGDREIEIAYL